jgi:hypothetical protein
MVIPPPDKPQAGQMSSQPAVNVAATKQQPAIAQALDRWEQTTEADHTTPTTKVADCLQSPTKQGLKDAVLWQLLPWIGLLALFRKMQPLAKEDRILFGLYSKKDGAAVIGLDVLLTGLFAGMGFDGTKKQQEQENEPILRMLAYGNNNPNLTVQEADALLQQHEGYTWKDYQTQLKHRRDDNFWRAVLPWRWFEGEAPPLLAPKHPAA